MIIGKQGPALREIRETDHARYAMILRILKDDGFEEKIETVSFDEIEDIQSDEDLEENVFAKERFRGVTDAMLNLSAREEKVLRHRFWFNDTLKETGVAFGGVTVETMRQLEAKAMRKLGRAERRINRWR